MGDIIAGIIILFIYYFLFGYLSTTEADKAYHNGNSLSFFAHDSGPHGSTEMAQEITADPDGSTGKATVLGTICTTTAGEGAAPILLIIVRKDAVPYSSVEKRATYIKRHVMKNNSDEEQQNIVVSDIPECLELTEDILEKSGIGIVDTLDLIEKKYMEATENDM